MVAIASLPNSNVVVNDNWSHKSMCQDFDLHAGLTNSTVHIGNIESDVASCPVVVKEPLMSSSMVCQFVSKCFPSV